MPPTNPPSSPTSLLWAHQLKREHGYLLNRMQKLETEIARVDSRTKSIDSSTTQQDLTALAAQVRALTQDGGRTAAENVRKEVMTRLETVNAEMEAVVRQVSVIEDQEEHNKEARERAHEVEDSLLKRVEFVEHSLREYEAGLKKLGREMDAAQTEEAWRMLGELKVQVQKGESGLESVVENVAILEEVGRELEVQNGKLAGRVEELAKASVREPITAVAPATDHAEDALTSGTLDHGETPTPRKKKAPAKSTSKKGSATRTKQTDMSAAQESSKPATGRVKKSRATVAQKAKSEASVAALSRTARPGLVQRRRGDKSIEPSIRRSGPGWVEYATSPEVSDVEEDEKDEELQGSPSRNVSDGAITRGRRQPRQDGVRSSVEVPEIAPKHTRKQPEGTKQEQSDKHRAPPRPLGRKREITAMDETEALAPRQTRSQLPATTKSTSRSNRPAPKTNRPMPKTSPQVQISNPTGRSTKVTKKSAPQKSQRNKGAKSRRDSSPISGPPAYTQRPDTQRAGIVDSDPESQELPPPPPPARKRRTIVQPDGDDIFDEVVVAAGSRR